MDTKINSIPAFKSTHDLHTILFILLISPSRLHVEKLYLYNNILEGIPFTVTEMTNLTLLDVSNNMLRTVPQPLCNLINLTHLYLRNNEIGDEDFPKDMRSLINLRDLNLSGNRMRTLPPSLFHLEGESQLLT